MYRFRVPVGGLFEQKRPKCAKEANCLEEMEGNTIGNI